MILLLLCAIGEISNMISKMAGVPVPMIQKQVGHKRLSTTGIYATVAPALVKEEYDLHGFWPEKRISRGN